ncbi:hypothetical protein Taro_006996 [Colocasia esculenta]|uniref:DUF4218 domain-containing protein n=1 Tax=Colocasia esculenta TaxID=4460 RepID=A0A843TQ90_COLES|nr:hypothetical protein [Colocasia esculenta]
MQSASGECMHDFKMKIRNKAQVEGSITQAYLIEEISNFCSMYFESKIRTQRTQPPCNDDIGDSNDNEEKEVDLNALDDQVVEWEVEFDEEEEWTDDEDEEDDKDDTELGISSAFDDEYR